MGDPHNFGKRVRVAEDGSILKPRTILWEWLFLGKDSPLRKLILESASAAAKPSPSDPFPALAFEFDENGSGRVERLDLRPPADGELRATDLVSAGTAIGTAFWFGLTDLHKSNVAFGMTKDGSLVLSPLDIECPLNQVSLPSQTHLTPSGRVSPKDCGLAALNSHLRARADPDDLAHILEGFLHTIEELEAVETRIVALLSDERFLKASVRVIARPSRAYRRESVDALRPPLADCERVQLERGDIPYFFRKADSREVLYLRSERDVGPADLPDGLIAPLLGMSRIPTEGTFPRRTAPSQWAPQAALQLARFFDPLLPRSKSNSPRVALTFEAGRIDLEAHGRFSAACRRAPADRAEPAADQEGTA